MVVRAGSSDICPRSRPTKAVIPVLVTGTHHAEFPDGRDGPRRDMSSTLVCNRSDEKATSKAWTCGRDCSEYFELAANKRTSGRYPHEIARFSCG